MATNLVRTGFQPYSDTEGGPTVLVRRRIASNNGTAIFFGDCMKITAAGVYGLATAGSGVIGSAQGAEYWDATTSSIKSGFYLPASTTYSSTAFDMGGDTDQSFVKISDSPVTDRFLTSYSASTPALTDMTKNANFVANAGTTYNGISGHVLDQTTIATTAALDFRIMEILQNPLSDPTQVASAGVIVMINQPGSAGTGLPATSSSQGA